jgi:hypothetical protein
VLEVRAAMWSQKLLQGLSLVGGRIVRNCPKLTITRPRKLPNHTRRIRHTSSCPIMSK